MTVEQLHDALGLLPSDLIAEADKRRNQGTRSVIHWYRWISLAACVVLILGCGLVFSRKILPGMGGGGMESAMQFETAADCAPEAPAAAAPMESPAAGIVTDESALEIPDSEESSIGTNSAVRGLVCESFLTPGAVDSIPAITVIHSREELEHYWQTYGVFCDFTTMQSGCDSYEDAWFESNDLLLLPVFAKSAETQWEITHFTQWGENGWEWAISYAFHTIAEEDELVGFHLLTGVEKGLISPEDDILTVADTINSTVNGEPFNE